MNTLLTGARRATLLAVLVTLTGCSTRPTAAPLNSGVDLANFDRSVRPQDDLYRFVNGNWLNTTEIPADRSNYGSFTKLAEEAETQLRTIIEEVSATAGHAPGSDEQKVADLYNGFMNEAKLEELGAAPLKAELARIAAVKDKKQIASLIAHLDGIGVRTPVGVFINQDAKEPARYIAYLAQSGLGLPDRDYYLLKEAKFKDIRKQYLAHVEKILALAGDKNAAGNARAIVALETALAQKQWTRVDSRDDDKTYNKKNRAELQALAPAFGWETYLKESNISGDTVIVAQPSAFTGFSEQLAAQSLGTWRAYFRWHLLKDYSPYLSRAFVDENFAFYGKTLRGIQENRPRWKRGVSAVQGGLEGDSPFASKGLGEVLGRIYVARHFPPQAKARMEEMVGNLLLAYRDSIDKLEWMSPETRTRALEKLAKFTTKIGYPDTWRDYSDFTIGSDDLVGNLMRGAEFDRAYQTAKLGKPVDRAEWAMMPQIVNAYYNANLNEIVFPAAILQPPFFNLAADDAVNYGGIGAVIGHEIGHGFDDQGSKSDGDGRLQSWWTAEDRRKFEARAQQLIEQYGAYEPLPGHKINGELTIGENIGDLGGATIAHQAYRLSLGGKPAPAMDGFTGDQRFFIGYAQIWARKYREEALLERLKIDSHSPSEYRANGIVTHVPGFYAAFDVRPGDRMYRAPDQRVKIW